MIKELKRLWYAKKIFIILYALVEILIFLAYFLNIFNNKAVGTGETLSFFVLFFAFIFPMIIFFPEKKDTMAYEYYLSNNFNFILYDLSFYIITIMLFLILSNMIKPNFFTKIKFDVIFYILFLAIYIFIIRIYEYFSLRKFSLWFIGLFFLILLIFLNFFFNVYVFSKFQMSIYLIFFLIPLVFLFKYRFSISNIKNRLIYFILGTIIVFNIFFGIGLAWFPYGNKKNTWAVLSEGKMYIYTDGNFTPEITKTNIYDLKTKEKEMFSHFSRILYKKNNKLIYIKNPIAISLLGTDDFDIDKKVIIKKNKKIIFKASIRNSWWHYYFPINFKFSLFFEHNIQNDHVFFKKDHVLYKLNLKEFSIEKLFRVKNTNYNYGAIEIKDSKNNYYLLFRDMNLLKTRKLKKYEEILKMNNDLYYYNRKEEKLYNGSGKVIVNKKVKIRFNTIEFNNKIYTIIHNELKELPIKKYYDKKRKTSIYEFYPLAPNIILTYTNNNMANIIDSKGDVILTVNMSLGKMYYYNKDFYAIKYDGKYFTIHKYENGKFNLYDKFRY